MAYNKKLAAYGLCGLRIKFLNALYSVTNSPDTDKTLAFFRKLLLKGN